LGKEVEQRGREILFTSDNDGTKNGFTNEALSKLSSVVNIPIIASGGAGNIQHFVDSFTVGKADAALAASVFHFKEIEIKALKTALKIILKLEYRGARFEVLNQNSNLHFHFITCNLKL
jgi:cyclase